MMRRIFNRIMLRTKCSDCGNYGKKFDNRNVKCFDCNSIWDGMADYEQQKVLIKEHNTVIRKI